MRMARAGSTGENCRRPFPLKRKEIRVRCLTPCKDCRPSLLYCQQLQPSAVRRSRALNLLAGGYLFTALIAVPHALTFPQVLSETGLLAAGPQSAAWLYLAAHAVLPVTIIAFAVRREDDHMIDDPASG